MSETALSREDVSRPEGVVAFLRGRLTVDADRSAAALRVVYAGVLAYAALFVFAAVVHYSVFQFARFDLGDMVQVVWNTLHGHVLETTMVNGRQANRLGFHVDPFLILLVPLFWVWSSPVVLLLTQTLAVASGALPVFWLARKHLGSARAGAHFAFAYLLYPATQFNAFPSPGMHAVSFAVPLVLYAVWLLDEDRILAFSVVALLAATTKEEIPIAVGCLGIWYAVRRGRRLFGLGVFVAGLAVTVFNFLWVIPHFSPSGVEPFAGRYTAVGGTPTGIFRKFFTDPMAFVHAVATGHKAVYLVLLLLPFLGLWLLEPLLLLGAVPDLVINLLSSKGAQTTLVFQYTAGIVPFVVAASILGAARFKRQAGRLSLVVLTIMAVLAIYSPILLLGRDVRALGSPSASAKVQALRLVPAGAPVSASMFLGGYLSGRNYIATFPYVGRARWIVVDTNDAFYRNAALARTEGILLNFKRTVRRYEADKSWQTVFSSHGIVVLHKRRAAGT